LCYATVVMCKSDRVVTVLASCVPEIAVLRPVIVTDGSRGISQPLQENAQIAALPEISPLPSRLFPAPASLIVSSFTHTQ
jgi:hypothetical protein